MTTDTLPPLTPLDADEIIDLVVASIAADPRIEGACDAALDLMERTSLDEWRPWIYVGAGLWSHACWLDKHERARLLVEPLGPTEDIISVAQVADSLFEHRVREIMAAVDELDAGRVSWRTRLLGLVIGVTILAVVFGGGFALAAATAGAATLQPDYPTAPGHEPSISVECDGDHVIAAVHPWDRGRRNFQVWNGGALLANVNEGQWSGRFKTVTHVVYSGTRYDVRHDDCVAPTTTQPAPTTTSTSTPATTTTEPLPSTTTTALPATSLPPATSTSVLSTASTITTHATTPAPTIPTPPTSDAGPTPSTVPSPVTARAGELPRTGGDASLGTIALIIGTLGLALWALSM